MDSYNQFYVTISKKPYRAKNWRLFKIKLSNLAVSKGLVSDEMSQYVPGVSPNDVIFFLGKLRLKYV